MKNGPAGMAGPFFMPIGRNGLDCHLGIWYIYHIKSEIYHKQMGDGRVKAKRNLYGAMGLLSLLGFIGICTEARSFLAFFAFAVDFEYFFLKSDEMLEEYMNKSASRAVYWGMIAMALVSLACFFTGWKGENEALLTGLTSGWVVSVAVYALSTAYYGFREKWGLEHDTE